MMDSIDLSLVSWSKAQFALTAMYHWIFVPLTLGFSIYLLHLWRRSMSKLATRSGNELLNSG